MLRRTFHLLFLLILTTTIVWCADTDPIAPDATTQADAGGDTIGRPDLTDDSAPDIVQGEPRWTRPDGYASIVFQVDDSANQTYEAAQMEWTGTFVYDDTTNLIEFASSWLPDQGPYPPLYDDGPYTTGGHEAEGQVADDHIFSAEIFFFAAETTVFDYGLLNELDHWIWTGPNGQVTVNANETGTVVAQGYAFEAFGDIDMRVQIDSASLHSEFATFDPVNDALFIKGSMVSWKPVQLLDDGNRGDAIAGDGVFTFTLSEYLGAHDGLLSMGQEAQFVFVFFDALGTEYKLTGIALMNGITAFSAWDAEQPTVFLEEELLLRDESRGSAQNTAILVGPDEPIPTEDPTILFVDPDRGPTTGGTAVEITGESFVMGAAVTFDGTAATCSVANETLITCTTPPRDTAGVVAVTVTNPDEGSDTHDLGFTYLDVAATPTITNVNPASGDEDGGDTVVISGTNFQDGASVSFGGQLSPTVTFDSTEQLQAVVPAAPPGAVDVTVRNPDGLTATLSSGFTYERQGIDWATLQWPEPTVLGYAGATLDTMYARVYEQDVTEGSGRGANIDAELLIGPDGVSPLDHFDQFDCHEMVFNTDAGNNDEYMLDGATVATAGDFDWVARFRVGGTGSACDEDNAWLYAGFAGPMADYNPAQAGSISIIDTDGVFVDTITPQAISLLGAANIDITGAQFADDMVVQTRLTGTDEAYATVGFTYTDTTAVQLNFPSPVEARATGRYDLLFDPSAAELDNLVVESAYLVGYVWTPTIDGVLDGETGWLDEFLHAAADRHVEGLSWEGSTLRALYASFDSDGLYLGLDIDLERNGNTLVCYVDTDFGSGTGFNRMATIADEDVGEPVDNWRLDRAITSDIDASGVAGFGAELAFGSMELGNVYDTYLDVLTGWRGLREGDNYWHLLDHECASGPCVRGRASEPGVTDGTLETFVPWTVVYGEDGIPRGGSEIALFCRIVNFNGTSISDQSLPLEESVTYETRFNVNQVVSFPVQ